MSITKVIDIKKLSVLYVEEVALAVKFLSIDEKKIKELKLVVTFKLLKQLINLIEL